MQDAQLVPPGFPGEVLCGDDKHTLYHDGGEGNLVLQRDFLWLPFSKQY